MMVNGCWYINKTYQQQGNRLTRRPCKGDKFEIEMFGAKTKRQHAGICGTCQTCLQHGHSFRLAGVWLKFNNLFIWPARWIILVLRVLKTNIRIKNLWFSRFPCKHPPDHPSIFLNTSLSASVPKCQIGKAAATDEKTRPHYDAISSCKPKSIVFWYTCCFFLCSMDIDLGILRCFHVPSICWVPATMALRDLPHKRPRK